uniref:Hemicentin-1-like von Willebrand factor A domain-containing protein n=1 Tax=Leptobrachium leishanense TaxID=445787 RepID=A0A8C5PCT3_9ANUR
QILNSVFYAEFCFLALKSSLFNQSQEEYAGNSPDGASTLAFVFDVTGSMYDDLVQVIEGASKILETSLNRPKKPLYNFALVPFHDPEIGPVTITTDPEKFQSELKELYVQVSTNSETRQPLQATLHPTPFKLMVRVSFRATLRASFTFRVRVSLGLR